jgi:hypothetical protein
MRTTKISVIALFGLVLIAATAAWQEAATVPATTDQGELTMTIALPQGDARAGRLVLLELQCNACHAVAGKRAERIKWPVSANQAPLLDRKVADMDPGKLVTSIIAPSHVVSAAVAEQSEGKLSPMGDFNHALTVRKLADLVAFLRTLDQPWEEPARPTPATP